jgi:hypothetical protein
MLKKIAAIFFLALLCSGTALAVEFSADTITTYKGGDKITGKMYYKADRFRMDMRANEDMVVITRLDKEVVWNVMPAEKMYMEMPFDAKKKPMVEDKFEGEVERKQVGAETVDGHPTKKYLITYKSGDRTDQVYQWIATDINFPVKNAAVDGSWTQEFRNVKMASQSDSLFEVPAGYQKVQMPQIPGGMNFMQGK